MPAIALATGVAMKVWKWKLLDCAIGMATAVPIAMVDPWLLPAWFVWGLWNYIDGRTRPL